MDTREADIIKRAGTLLDAAQFAPLSRSTCEEYVRVADRVQAARVAAGQRWRGLAGLPGAANTKSMMRAAWSRRTHREVAMALRDLRARSANENDCLARLEDWVPEAEACRPCPGHAVQASATPVSRLPTLSKRHVLHELPGDWLDQLWAVAVERECKHLDALAILITTGCRPAEVCHGVAVRAVLGALEVAIAGVKVSGTNGQPWRRLSVQLDGCGPVAHLAMLACMTVDGVARVSADCSPAALSMAITDLASECGFAHRVSPYDIRHQRSADAKTAFGGDPDRIAAWLGHAGTSSARHYGRLPQSAGVRGPLPVGAVAPREVRHAVRAKVNLVQDSHSQ